MENQERKHIDGYLHINIIAIQVRKFLLGEVLTLIDSSVSNERQCKALKDSIKTAFSRKTAWMSQLSGDKYASEVSKEE